MNFVMVILNYNDSRRAWALAEKCSRFSIIDNVIIVDNKSTDDSVEFLLKKNYENIKIILSEKNNGFASGNNIGVRYAKDNLDAKYILFANTDTIFTEKDVQKCLIQLESDENLGLVSMRIKDIKGNEERSAWKFKTYWDYLLSNFWVYRHNTYKKATYKNFKTNFQYVDIVRGSFMLFKADALSLVDYFDEGTFLYYEEEIIAYRLKRAKYKVGLLTDCSYIHNHISSKNQNIWFGKKNYDKSLRYFLSNYYKINILQKMFFDIAVKISDVETLLMQFLKRRKNV